MGLLDAQLMERREDDPKPAPGRSFRARQSCRWMASMQRSEALLRDASMVTVVADREADIDEMFACLEERPSDDHEVVLAARPGQWKRTARLAVRFGSTTLRHPRNRAPEEGVTRTQQVCLVEAFEVCPPKCVSPIHWRLLTRHEVSSFDQARWIIRLYRQRWILAPLFRTTKTQGFDIERVSMSTAPFRNLCAMTLVADMSCLQLVQDRDGAGQRPLEDVFSPADRAARQKSPYPAGSLAFAARVCARLGGWNCYDRKPGPVVMLRELYQFRAIQLGYGLKGDV